MRNLAFALSLFALALSASAQTFTAKVVGVHDGDTITVYDDREQTKAVKVCADAERANADGLRECDRFDARNDCSNEMGVRAYSEMAASPQGETR